MYNFKYFGIVFAAIVILLFLTLVSSDCLLNVINNCTKSSECCHKTCHQVSDTLSLCRNYRFRDCRPHYEKCIFHKDCCSRRCIRYKHVQVCYGTYEPSPRNCLKDGEECKDSLNCCSKESDGHFEDGHYVCTCKGSEYKPCLEDGYCAADGDCCSGVCSRPPHASKFERPSCAGENNPGALICRKLGEECEHTMQCCEGFCDTNSDYKSPWTCIAFEGAEA